MSFKKQLPSFLFTILQIVLAQLAGTTSISAETWTTNGFLRISDKIPVQLQQHPDYYVQEHKQSFPDFRSFKTFDNNSDEALIRHTISYKNLWLRIPLMNASKDTIRVALRIYTQCKSLTIYSKEGAVWKIQHGGHAYPGKSIPGSFYEAVLLTLPPGTNMLYLNHDTPMGRFTLSNFDLVHPDELGDDKVEMIESISNFIFVLVSFLFIIVFQLGYVAVQWYYHRKPEYIDYLSYLFLIGLYFFLRYAYIFRVEFVLYHFSDFMPVVNDLLLILPYFYYLRFSRHFINMRERFPGKNRQIQLVEKGIAVVVVIMAVALWLIDSSSARFVSMIVLIPLFIYSIYLVVYFYKRRDSVIRFFLIGSICAASGHFLAMMLSMFPEMYLTHFIPPINITIIGLVLEIFFFNTGLGYKAKHEQDEKLKLQLEYYRQIEETRKVQDKLQHMRNNIASDLHDDVGSTLSSIGIYSQLATQQINSNPEVTKEILEKINQATQRMMEAMSDIVWAIHSRNDEGVDLFIRMRQFAVEHLSLSGISFELEVQEKVAGFTFTMEARRNLMLLFKEILHNASKYSRGTLVKGAVVCEDDQLVMTLQDNGVGFDAATGHKGHGLPGYDMRTKSLGGRYSIESSQNGTIVKIWLPLANIIS